MNWPVDLTPIVMTLPQNHDYRQHSQSEHLTWDKRDAGVKFARRPRSLSWDAGVWVVLRVAGLTFNTSCHRAAVRYYVIEVGRLVLYDFWQLAWFLFLGIKNLFRKGLAPGAQLLR
jgi:hypothetical protein